jgi:ABC-type Na+ efflux pump permease subunit
MDLGTLGRYLVLFAAALAVVGGLLILGGRLGLGSLPGDVRIQGEGYSCFVPIVTSIVLSLILTIVLNLIIRWFR